MGTLRTRVPPRKALAAIVVVGLAACGTEGTSQTTSASVAPTTSGTAVTTTSGTDLPDSTTTTQSTTTTTIDWRLPEGPKSPAGPAREYRLYVLLADHECAEAQARLDDEWWEDFETPRSIIVYQAAVDVCAGYRDQGRQWIDQASQMFGWRGLSAEIQGFPYECVVYQAVMSVLEQRPSQSFDCPDGDPPPWAGGRPKDDPRTPTDESTVASTTEATTSTTVGSDSTTEATTSTTVGSGSTTTAGSE